MHFKLRCKTPTCFSLHYRQVGFFVWLSDYNIHNYQCSLVKFVIE